MEYGNMLGQAQAQYAGAAGLQQQNTVQPTSLTSDMTRACGRISEMLTRLAKIADSLHGGQPHPADINKNPSPTPSLRRELDVMHQLLSECEGEVVRIEQRL